MLSPRLLEQVEVFLTLIDALCYVLGKFLTQGNMLILQFAVFLHVPQHFGMRGNALVDKFVALGRDLGEFLFELFAFKPL